MDRPFTMDRPTPPHRIRIAASALLVAVTVLAVGGCSTGGGSDAGPTSTPPTTAATATSSKATTSTTATSTTTSSTSTSTTATTVPGTGPGGTTTAGLGSLPEGTHYGYFTGVSDGQVEGQQVQVVSFDKVDFLTGDAAVEAAIAHGDAPAGATSVDNDYYVVNDNKALRLLPVIPDGQVFILPSGSTELQSGSIDEAVTLPNLYKIEVVVVRGVSLITSTAAVYLP